MEMSRWVNQEKYHMISHVASKEQNKDDYQMEEELDEKGKVQIGYKIIMGMWNTALKSQ